MRKAYIYKSALAPSAAVALGARRANGCPLLSFTYREKNSFALVFVLPGLCVCAPRTQELIL